VSSTRGVFEIIGDESSLSCPWLRKPFDRSGGWYYVFEGQAYGYVIGSASWKHIRDMKIYARNAVGHLVCVELMPVEEILPIELVACWNLDETEGDIATNLEPASGGLYIGAGSNLESGSFFQALVLSTVLRVAAGPTRLISTLWG